MLGCETIAVIEEYIKQVSASSGKPSYQFGRASTVNVNTWLDSNTIPSNKTGLPFGLKNGLVADIWIGNELLVEYDVSLYYHLGDEIGLNLLTSVTVPAAARTNIFTVADFGLVLIPQNVQIAARVTAVPGTNPRNVSIHATLIGNA
jgi:hypothetical protein